MLMDGNKRNRVLSPAEFPELLLKGEIAFPSITEEEIEDRSKADGLAKGIAVLQTTWFIAQCISRTAQGLIITEIELITLAIAALNGILYFLWWNKPLDVKCSVPVLLLPGKDRKPVEIPRFEPKSKLFYLIDLKEMNRRNAPEWSQIFSSIFSWVHMRWLLNSLGRLKGYMAGLLHRLIQHIKERTLTVGTITIVKTALVELLKFPFRMIWVLLGRSRDIFASDEVNEGANWIPTFYAYSRPDSDEETLMVWPLIFIVAILFGGIHCAGWNFPFPSHAELIIWRVSSLIILTVPCIGALPIGLAAIEVDDTSVTDSEDIADDILLCWELWKGFFILITLAVFIIFGVGIYFLARFTLFVEAFIALRHLPPGAYAVVEWTALLLHM